MCRKPKSTTTRTNLPNVNSMDENTTNNSVNAVSNFNYNPDCESVYDSSDDNMVASSECKTLQIERKNTILQIGNIEIGLLIDSGSGCSIP